MARRSFTVVDAVENLEHWYSGRAKLVVAGAWGRPQDGPEARGPAEFVPAWPPGDDDGRVLDVLEAHIGLVEGTDRS